jgi:hypothetical protein
MIELPPEIKKVGFDFNWDERKVWELDVPAEDMPMSDLEWHFDLPFWRTDNTKHYNLRPIDVIENKELYKEEFDRTMASDVSYPIDVMYWKNNWLILDGLHRLLKLKVLGYDPVKVRKIPEVMIPQITIKRD